MSSNSFRIMEACNSSQTHTLRYHQLSKTNLKPWKKKSKYLHKSLTNLVWSSKTSRSISATLSKKIRRSKWRSTILKRTEDRAQWSSCRRSSNRLCQRRTPSLQATVVPTATWEGWSRFSSHKRPTQTWGRALAATDLHITWVELQS